MSPPESGRKIGSGRDALARRSGARRTSYGAERRFGHCGKEGRSGKTPQPRKNHLRRFCSSSRTMSWSGLAGIDLGQTFVGPGDTGEFAAEVEFDVGGHGIKKLN